MDWSGSVLALIRYISPCQAVSNSATSNPNASLTCRNFSEMRIEPTFPLPQLLFLIFMFSCRAQALLPAPHFFPFQSNFPTDASLRAISSLPFLLSPYFSGLSSTTVGDMQFSLQKSNVSSGFCYFTTISIFSPFENSTL